MGIILDKSKSTFDELIGPNSFDEIFKNSIRDYYIYGFKSYDQFAKGSQIVKDRWRIFAKVLGQKWYFEKRKNGRNQIVLKTSHDGENPLDDFYFMHYLSKIGDYLNYLIDLDDRSYFQGGVNKLPVELNELLMVEGENGPEALVDKDEIEYAIIDNWLKEIQDEKDKDVFAKHVRINRQLNIWSARTRYLPVSFRDKYANLSNRTEYLYSLGVLGDLRDNPDQRNAWLKEQWDRYNPEFRRYFNRDTSGDHFWFKSPVTMLMICEQQRECTQTESDSFLINFKQMCGFFAQYYPLGEVGTLLTSRCESRLKIQDPAAFRFKHNYLQKTLYDYNLLDFLVAIENRYLCLIRYAHGINLNTIEELVIPLEIRISVTNGREYVLYYQVTEKRIKALRLEFIDKITIYKHVSTIKRVRRHIAKEGKKKNYEVHQLGDIRIDEHELAQQIIIARRMLPYIWGTDISECYVDENWKNRLITFNMELLVQYDETSERYIETRLKKENRLLEDDKEITVFPTKELRNWVRSYYCRITRPESINISSFNVADDVEDMWKVYYKSQYFENREDKQEPSTKDYSRDYFVEGYEIEGELVPPTEGHVSLFNELFSWYSIILADSVLSMDDTSDLDAALKRNIETRLKYFTAEEVESVVSELKQSLLDSELIDNEGKCRFKLNGVNYLYDLLPLTKIEVRWLMTITDDPLALIFLSPEQIEVIKEALEKAPFKVKKLPFNAINYFDRYNRDQHFQKNAGSNSNKSQISNKELCFLRILYHAIKYGNKVKVVFKNWMGKKYYITCAPVWIEYSRRDDVFRVSYVHNSMETVRTINVPRIISVIELQDKHFDLQEKQEQFEKILKHTMTEIKVEFYQGTRNLPDRILTEFSLWKKKCVFDVSSGKYTMTLYYSTSDEKEILLRLLGYGPYIRIVADDDNYILLELKRRIVKQRDIIRSREFELG